MFTKRMYDLPGLTEDLFGFFRGLPRLASAFASGRIDPAFREKILLAVSAVNDCRYCKFVHSSLAEHLSVDPCEIEAILGQEFDDGLDEKQRFALTFAAHYAESEKVPDESMQAELVQVYGKETAEDILAFIQMIYLANLTGNTFDGFLSRIKGEPATGSNALFEAALFVVTGPVLLPQAAYLGLRRLLGAKPESACSQ